MCNVISPHLPVGPHAQGSTRRCTSKALSSHETGLRRGSAALEDPAAHLRLRAAAAWRAWPPTPPGLLMNLSPVNHTRAAGRGPWESHAAASSLAASRNLVALPPAGLYRQQDTEHRTVYVPNHRLRRHTRVSDRSERRKHAGRGSRDPAAGGRPCRYVPECLVDLQCSGHSATAAGHPGLGVFWGPRPQAAGRC